MRAADTGGMEVLFTQHPLALLGSHRDTQYLVCHLALRGAGVSQRQNSARFNLAGSAPTKALADMLGLTTATFEKYASLSGGFGANSPLSGSNRTAMRTKRTGRRSIELNDDDDAQNQASPDTGRS
jgi:hypothetical protein